MQSDYYGYTNQMYPQSAYSQYTCTPYGVTAMPMNRTIDNLKKKNKSFSASKQFDDFSNNSTDESIHLVRSRKTGESRYDTNQMLKKRSQSGTSIMKGMASQLYAPIRSQSDERSISPSLMSEKRRNKKDRKKKQSTQYSTYDDESNYTFTENRLVDSGYLLENQPVYQQPLGGMSNYYQPQQYSQYQQDSYQQSQYQQQCPQASVQGYNSAPPGAPIDYYNQSSQQFYQQPESYCSQQYEQHTTPQVAPQGCTQGLPNGAKIVAEYFLGYLDENQQQQPQYSQLQQYQCPEGCVPDPSYQAGQSCPQQQIQSCPQQQIQSCPQQQIQSCPQQQIQSCPQSQGYPQSQCYSQAQAYSQGYPQYQEYTQDCYQPQEYTPANAQEADYAPQPEFQTESEYQSEAKFSSFSSIASKDEEVDIEIWDKKKKDKKSSKGKYDKKKSFDDFKKLSDIIDALERKIGNINVSNGSNNCTNNGNSDPIQPIFLMPKQEPASEQKPIYVPRNIYVPVIRPVFVPRERIIVRPQIIHVARPVLVDRPVPIQQRPLVIERDRPVPVRVETVERTEPCGEYEEESDCKPEQGATETTYHEFTQASYPQRSESNGDFQQESGSNYNFSGTTEEVDKNKQLVLDLLEEAERRKKSLESKSNDSFANKFTSESSKVLDSMPYNSGYTLEVLDQRVSDKFEKVDQETIKQRYGVDSFQYLPTDSQRPSSSATNDFYQAGNEATLRSSGGSYKSLASANETVSNAYGNFASSTGLAESSASLYGQNYGSNGNISSILNDLAKMASNK